MVTSKSNITTFIRFSLLDKLKLLFGSHLRIETSIELLANVEVAGLNAHSTTHVESTGGVFVRHPFPPFGYAAVLPEDSHRAPRSAPDSASAERADIALNELRSESLVFDSPKAAEIRHAIKSASSLPDESSPQPPPPEADKPEGFSLDDAVRVMRQNESGKRRKRLLSAFAMQRDQRYPESASVPVFVPERHPATPVLFYPACRFGAALRYSSASKALLVFSRDGGGPYSCKLIDISGSISTEPPAGFAPHSFVMFSSSGLALIDRHDPDLVKPPLPVYEGHCVFGAAGFLIGEVLDGSWLLEFRLGAGGERIDWENRLCIPI